MPSDPVTLTVWTAEPGGRWRMTAPAGDGGSMSWTTTASPSGSDEHGPLTLDDLRGWYRELGYRVTETDFDGDGNPEVVALRDRVRRAIEAAERTTP